MIVIPLVTTITSIVDAVILADTGIGAAATMDADIDAMAITANNNDSKEI